MIQLTFKLEQSGPGAKAVLAGIKNLVENEVYVGIPEARAPRKGEPVTNAQLAFFHTHGVRKTEMRRIMKASQLNKNLTYSQALQLYIHTHGSPLWQIPPRPIIEPAIEEQSNQRMIEAELRKAAEAGLDGKKDLMIVHFKRAGMIAQNVVRGWFTNPKNHWAPNAPSTIARKGSDMPLIDKGALRAAMIYVLGKKRSGMIVP